MRRQLSEAQQKNLELASMLGLDSKQIIQEASSLTEMVDYMPASIEGQNMAELENVKAELTSLQEEREELLRQLRQIGYEWVRSAEGKLKLARLNTSLEPNLLAQVEQGIPELSKRDAIWMRMYFIRHVRIADIANLSGVTRAAVSYRILKGVLSIKKFLGSKPSP